MQTKHAKLVTELVAAWNAHNAERVATLYAAQHEGFDSGLMEPLNGPEAVQAYCANFFAAFPDAHIQVEEIVAEEDRCAVAWQAQGTHLGKLMNIPPSSKVVNIRGMSILTIEEGKFTRSNTIWDMAAFLRAIGLLPRLTR